jgi:hypothetical protein
LFGCFLKEWGNDLRGIGEMPLQTPYFLFPLRWGTLEGGGVPFILKIK